MKQLWTAPLLGLGLGLMLWGCTSTGTEARFKLDRVKVEALTTLLRAELAAYEEFYADDLDKLLLARWAGEAIDLIRDGGADLEVVQKLRAYRHEYYTYLAHSGVGVRDRARMIRDVDRALTLLELAL